MKMKILLLAAVLALALAGCGQTPAGKPVNGESHPSTTTQPTKITEEQAIDIASRHWGIKSGDVDEKTGFPFLIMPAESGNANIRIDLKWLVNNTNYSTVDTVEIDPYTGEIVTEQAE